MKSRNLIAALIIAGSSAFAQVPQHLNYQGRVSVYGLNYNGTGQFKFALGNESNQSAAATAVPVIGSLTDGQGPRVLSITLTFGGYGYVEAPAVTITHPNGTGAAATAVVEGGIVTSINVTDNGLGYDGPDTDTIVSIAPPPPNMVFFSAWSNDGTNNPAGPAAAVTLPVVNGLYSVKLGDTAAGMAVLNPGVFASGNHLRVWFSHDGNDFQQLTPDQPLGTAPYAFRAIEAERVGFSAITSDMIKEGAVGAAQIANGAVGSTKIANGAISPTTLNTGGNAPAAGQVLSFTNEGMRWVEGLSLPFNPPPVSGATGQAMFHIQDTTPLNGIGVRGDSTNGSGVYGTSTSGNGVVGESSFSGGGGVRGFTTSTGAGAVGVQGSASGDATAVYANHGAGNGPALKANGRSDLYGWLYIYDTDLWLGHITRRGEPGRAIVDWRDPGSNTSQLYLNFANDWQETVIGGTRTRTLGEFLECNGALGQRAYIGGDGNMDVQFGSLNPDVTEVTFFNPARNGGERMNIHARDAHVRQLTIYGGADLAEPFAMSHDDVEPGSVVVIDEVNPGKLRMSRDAYDKKVAGIVSGADGINPGISMIQEDMLEAGENVALSGRVYVKANNSAGDIQPGDLLTTSAIPGEAMKASDHDRAQGAILGKAMTSLSEKSGKVLVLVTLQ